MSAISIAKMVLEGIGNLAPLAVKLFTAGKEEQAKILSDMQAETDKMNSYLRAGGTLDDNLAEHDAKLDKAIAAAENEAAKKAQIVPGSDEGC
jgi:hypothetical protein